MEKNIKGVPIVQMLLDVSENNKKMIRSGNCIVKIPKNDFRHAETWKIRNYIYHSEFDLYDEARPNISLITTLYSNIHCVFELHDGKIQQEYFISDVKLVDDDLEPIHGFIVREYNVNESKKIMVDCGKIDRKHTSHLAISANVSNPPNARDKVFGSVALNKGMIQSYFGGKSRRKKRRYNKTRKTRKNE